MPDVETVRLAIRYALRLNRSALANRVGRIALAMEEVEEEERRESQSASEVNEKENRGGDSHEDEGEEEEEEEGGIVEVLG